MKIALAVLFLSLIVLAACGEAGIQAKRDTEMRPRRASGWGRARSSTDESKLGKLTVSTGVVFQVPCPCAAPPLYNVVCGTDGRSYANQELLKCASRCGFNVRLQRLGACKAL